MFYQPPPNELHVYNAILGAAFPNALTPSTSQTGSITVHGRDAVPFLTSSNLPRPVLKPMWSAVDPEHKGVLRSLGQFYTLLRLVAIGQFQAQRHMPVQVDLNTVLRMNTTALPPPFFQGLRINVMPMQQQQQQRKQSVQPPQSVQPSQPVQPTTPPRPPAAAADDSFGDFSAPTPSTPPPAAAMGLSGLDALPSPGLGSMPMPELPALTRLEPLAPAPAMGFNLVTSLSPPVLAASATPDMDFPVITTSPSPPVPIFADDDDEFGDFASTPAPEPPVASPPTVEPPVAPVSAMSFSAMSFSADSFSMAAPPSPSLAELSAAPASQTDAPLSMMLESTGASKLSVFDDLVTADVAATTEEFGDFEDAPPPPADSDEFTLHTTPAPASPVIESEFVVALQTTPAPKPPSFGVALEAEVDDDEEFGDFGDFEAAEEPKPAPAPTPAPAPAQEEDDPFGDLSREEVPEPQLMPLEAPLEAPAETFSDDDFGDFDSALPSAPPTRAADLSIEYASNTSDTAKNIEISSPPPIRPNAAPPPPPPPTLAPSSPPSPQPLVVEPAVADDSFGDFEDPPEIQSQVPTTPNPFNFLASPEPAAAPPPLVVPVQAAPAFDVASARSCPLDRLAELLAENGMYALAQKAAGVKAISDEVARLNQRKAEAAMEDRFEEAMEIRGEINKVKETMPTDGEIAAWREALCDDQKRCARQKSELVKSTVYIAGVDANEDSARAAFESIRERLVQFWEGGQTEEAVKLQKKLVVGCSLRSKVLARGGEKVGGGLKKLLGVCR